jgi:lipid-A-disaccharide synthase
MKELMKLDTNAEFSFLGGGLMEQVANRKPTIHIEKMAFMGFIDVLKNISKIKANFKIVKEDILNYKPDVVILVDYPGFNLRMAKWAKEKGFKVFFYISPTVWAWKENRVEIIRKYVDKLFVILPFEEEFYKKHNYKVEFVGHPLMDSIEQKKKTLLSKEEFINRNKLSNKPLIAILPGSRKQEIDRMFRIMLEIKDEFTNYEFVIGGSSNIPKEMYSPAIEKGIKVVFDQTYELMLYAEAGVIKSGTSTLESALFELPEVVCYKGGQLSFMIAKQLVDVKYISLVNLIMDKPIVKELIQSEMTAKNISAELKELLYNKPYREEMIRNYKELKTQLGGTGASERLARSVYNAIKN